MFRINGAFEKGGKDRIIPMVPEFAKFLDKSGRKNEGCVFNPTRMKECRTNQRCGKPIWVSIIGSRIGKNAEIVVSNGAVKTKHASFHDLRRSFGDRWSRRVMPQILMKLMRHESIETTLCYYVGHDAEKIAVEIWNI